MKKELKGGSHEDTLKIIAGKKGYKLLSTNDFDNNTFQTYCSKPNTLISFGLEWDIPNLGLYTEYAIRITGYDKNSNCFTVSNPHENNKIVSVPYSILKDAVLHAEIFEIL